MTINHFRTLFVTTLFFVVIASSVAPLPAAADSLDASTVTVKYWDLNLSHPQDAALLYGRIRSAAKIVCSRYDGHSISAMKEKDTCMNMTILSTVTKFNNAALSAVYSAKTGKAQPALFASQPNK